jgi:hypothetical protein
MVMSPAGGIAVKLISVIYYKSIYTGALPLEPHFILFLG